MCRIQIQSRRHTRRDTACDAFIKALNLSDIQKQLEMANPQKITPFGIKYKKELAENRKRQKQDEDIEMKDVSSSLSNIPCIFPKCLDKKLKFDSLKQFKSHFLIQHSDYHTIHHQCPLKKINKLTYSGFRDCNIITASWDQLARHFIQHNQNGNRYKSTDKLLIRFEPLSLNHNDTKQLKWQTWFKSTELISIINKEIVDKLKMSDMKMMDKSYKINLFFGAKKIPFDTIKDCNKNIIPALITKMDANTFNHYVESQKQASKEVLPFVLYYQLKIE